MALALKQLCCLALVALVTLSQAQDRAHHDVFTPDSCPPPDVTKLRVLMTGATGYLGQFLTDELVATAQDLELKLKVTFSSNQEGCRRDVSCEKLDLTQRQDVEAMVRDFRPTVVVNLAAISSIYKAEKDPELAQRINDPRDLLRALEMHSPEALFIQLSTDQVYAGNSGPYSEDSETNPVNAYGKSKLMFEKTLQRLWPRHITLRSSLIYGPPTPRPSHKASSFIQFVDREITSGHKVHLFADEYRCPIHVEDVNAAILWFIHNRFSLPASKLFNLGGPQSLSRAEIGALVARQRGLQVGDVIVGAFRRDRAMEVAAPGELTLRSQLVEQTIGRKFTELERRLGELVASDRVVDHRNDPYQPVAPTPTPSWKQPPKSEL